MKKSMASIIVVLSVVFSGLFLGCVTDTASMKIEKSLPQNKLAYYNDSFDKFRTDLWEKAGYIQKKAQEANFKIADMFVEDGKIRIDTKTGCFSKGGLGSKYALRGDFDIQIDCHIDFLEGVQQDMDQIVIFLVIDRGSKIGAINSVMIGLTKKKSWDFSNIFSSYTKKGRYHPGKWHRIGNFHGTLQIVRTGSNISTMYKREGETEWKAINTFQFGPNDVMLGFKLQNYIGKRRSITAKLPFTATFDNFRINAAEEIIEEDI